MNQDARLFDVNAALGHWPFRRVPDTTAEALRARLAARGIRRAAVVNTQGLFYKNCHDANLELADWIAPHRDFFVGVATLNPGYAAWDRDLDACAGALGLRALRLAPPYHDYALADPCAREIAAAASALGLPMFLPHRIVDVRQRHWLDIEQALQRDDALRFLEAVPEARVIVTGAGWRLPLDERGRPRYPNLYLECSRARLTGLHAGLIGQLLFGTGAPFKEVSPALLNLQTTGLDRAAQQAIGWSNAARLFGLDKET